MLVINMKRSEIDIDTIIKEYEECGNLHKLAKKFSTSHIRLSNLLKENGVKIRNIGRRKDFTEDDINSMINDYNINNMTMGEVSKKYDIRIKRLRAIFKERNVKIARKNYNFLTKEEFIEKSRNIHGDKYDYSKVEYVNAHTKVCIICHIHGEFWQTPDGHYINGQGCPQCRSSKLETMVINELKKNNIEYEYQYKIENTNRTIDFYIPHKNIYIECQGEQHYVPVKFSKTLDESKSIEVFKKRIIVDKEKYQYAIDKNCEMLYFTLPSHFLNKDIKINEGFYYDKLIFSTIETLIEYIKNK